MVIFYRLKTVMFLEFLIDTVLTVFCYIFYYREIVFSIKKMWLYIFGLAIHIIFFISVFDIYFRSPIIHGMEPHSSPLEPVAQRLVLFVADGLRADSFFNYSNDISRAPYLR